MTNEWQKIKNKCKNDKWQKNDKKIFEIRFHHSEWELDFEPHMDEILIRFQA